MSELDTLHFAVAALSAVVLFIHGLQSFSQEVQRSGGERLRDWLRVVARSRWAGFSMGAAVTALVQSSSAVASLVVSLVDARVLTFSASLAVLLGANVGTTLTAWLVSFELTAFGPWLIVLGTLWSVLPFRSAVAGRALFYLGFILFCLDLIAGMLSPLASRPEVIALFARTDSVLVGALLGLAFTAVVQSSSVTTGIVVVLVQQGLLDPGQAIPIVLGANIGTTSTSLIASAGLSRTARRAAHVNLAFNTAGVLVFLLMVGPFTRTMISLSPDPALQVAWAHLCFNLGIALAFMATWRWWTRLLPASEAPDGP